MATDRKLRADLLKRLKISKQALSQRAARIKREMPMSTEHAIYIVAHETGMDLSRYLAPERVAEVRAIRASRGNGGAVAPTAARKAGARDGVRTVRPVRIGGDDETFDTLLPESVIEQAKRMSRNYSRFYVLENAVRDVVMRVLKAKYGPDWWGSRVPNDPKRKVEARKQQEDKTPWHARRGVHEVYYCDFGDLRAIIEHNWRDFEAVLDDRPAVVSKLKELEPSRNVIAHNNPLSGDDEDRIKVYLRFFSKLFKAKAASIPAA